jgi:hypothetical protein
MPEFKRREFAELADYFKLERYSTKSRRSFLARIGASGVRSGHLAGGEEARRKGEREEGKASRGHEKKGPAGSVAPGTGKFNVGPGISTHARRRPGEKGLEK